MDNTEVPEDSLYCTTKQIYNLFEISIIESFFKSLLHQEDFSWLFLLCCSLSLLTCFFLDHFFLIRFSQELKIRLLLLTRTNEFNPVCIFKLALQTHEAVLCFLPDISSQLFHVVDSNLGQVT